MAKQRILKTTFWRKGYILSLPSDARFLFLWAISNPATELCGAYEAAMQTIEFETGLTSERILEIFNMFERAGKIIYRHGWVIVCNFSKHQNATSTNIQKGVERSLNDCPDWVKETLSNPIHTVSVGIDTPSKDMHILSNQTLPRPEPRPRPRPRPRPELIPNGYMSANADPDVHEKNEASNPEKEEEASYQTPTPKTAAARAVFEYWQAVLNKHQFQFTDGRRAIINARLKRFSVDELKQAIDTVAADPFYLGVNDRGTEYTDFKTIFKNEEKVENLLFNETKQTNGTTTNYKQQEAERARDSFNHRKQIQAQLREDGLLDGGPVIRLGRTNPI